MKVVAQVLIYGDTIRSPTLRHEVPLAIIDAFLYLESDGRRAVMTNALEEERIAAALPALERLLVEDLGRDELLAGGCAADEVERELCVRATAELGISDALVPPDFPLALADRLRAQGVELRPEESLFAHRRRHKTAAEMAGVRRAADAALAGMAEAARVLREAAIDGEQLRFDGRTLDAETLRTRIREVCARAGAPAPGDIMVAPMRPGDPIGHDPGAGPLPAHAPIAIDLWPQDEASGCWADMTRTFVAGGVSDAIAQLHTLVLTAHDRACAAIRPGATGVEIFGVACDVFEDAGHPTQRTKRPGETLRHGFYFSLGHGVGLEVHEAPALGRTGSEPLIAGDVLAVEPGTVDPRHGGMRVEDLLVVTDSGADSLTHGFPHQLRP